MQPGCAAPLSAVDTVVVISDHRATARKRISATDPYLAGHYPGFPIYPGVFTLESTIQAVRHLVSATRAGKHAELRRIVSMRLTGPLLPGDELVVEVTIKDEPSDGPLRISAQCSRSGDESVATLILDFHLSSPGADVS